MVKAWQIGIFVGVVALGLWACGSSSIPTATLTNQNFKVLDTCQTDFRQETGLCYIVEGNTLSKGCARVENDCKQHFYIGERDGIFSFVHVNVPYPCYSQWVVDGYNDPDSPYYENSSFNVVSFQLASLVVDDVVQLYESNLKPDLQTGDTCLYRIETGILNLTRGEYTVKIWNPKGELLFQTPFNR